MLCSNPNAQEVIGMGNQLNDVKTQMLTGFNMAFTVVASYGMAYYISTQLGLQRTQVGSS
jgi:hypothetical protein